jgi:Holliday junction resolvase-like predicted endonuclease
METFTVRDVLTMLALAGGLVSVWVAVNVRQAKSESRLDVVEAARERDEKRIDDLVEKHSETRVTLAELCTRLDGVAAQMGTLESKVTAGFTDVLRGMDSMKRDLRRGPVGEA